MKHLFPFVLAITLVSICASQAFSQTNVAANAIVQKKHKIFVRANFAGYNLSFYPNAWQQRNLYSGIHTSFTIGYCVSDKVRLGIGAEAAAEGYISSEGEGSTYASLPVYASFEYGNHSRKVSPFIDVNAGYAFLENGQEDLNYDTYTLSGGPLVEVVPGISFGSKQYPYRWRIGIGDELQYTTITRAVFTPIYPDGPGPLQPFIVSLMKTGVDTYHTLITRAVLELGVDF